MEGVRPAMTPLSDELRDRGRRRAGFILLVGGLTLGLNVLLLRAPAPEPGTEHQYCVTVQPLGAGFRHIMNCDSEEFLALAKAPNLLLSPYHRLWQSRPLFTGLAYAIARPLQPLTSFGPRAAELTAYTLINLAAVILAVLCFARLLQSGQAGVPVAAELMFPLGVLMTNDVTKAFFWTPHVQVFNIFVPCLTLYLNFRLIDRGRPLESHEAVLLGLALGVGVTIYGSVAIPVLCAAAVQGLVYRRILAPVLLGAASLAPFACWFLFVRLVTGSFYSNEVEAFRQFVWMGDCIRAGWAACAQTVKNNAWLFARYTAPVILMPIVLAGGCRVARHLWPGIPAPPLPKRGALTLAIAFSLVVTTTFLALMGFYVTRLSWMLVPPLLLILAIELRDLRLSRADPAGSRFKAGVLAAYMVYFIVLLVRRGPYS